MIDKLLALIAVVMLFVVVGIIGYQEISTSKVVVDVQLQKGEDPFQTFRTILPPDSKMVDVCEIDKANNEYKLTVSTRRHKLHLLDWLRKNKRVVKAEELIN